MADYTRPRPAVSSLNRPYWEGLRQHRFVMPQCRDCGKTWYPPTPFCPACWSRSFAWQELSGRGRVNSWVVFHRAYFSSFEDAVPYNVAEVELEDGPRLLTNLVEVDNTAIRIGMRVEIHFDDVSDDITLAKFRPLKGS